jgi:hypothetical protein
VESGNGAFKEVESTELHLQLPSRRCSHGEPIRDLVRVLSAQLPRKEVASSLVTAMGVLWAVSCTPCYWSARPEVQSIESFSGVCILLLHGFQVMGGALLYLIPYLSNVHSKWVHPGKHTVHCLSPQP